MNNLTADDPQIDNTDLLATNNNQQQPNSTRSSLCKYIGNFLNFWQEKKRTQLEMLENDMEIDI